MTPPLHQLDFNEGQTLLFNKPKTWTSFDVVKKVRGLTRAKKVGHAGTLDPLATGLLILCTGKHTKRIEQIQGQEKEYEALIKLGATTASYDAEFPEEHLRPTEHITEALLAEHLRHFVGTIQQMPPAFSAIKVGGKRSYKAARKGQSLKLRPRQVAVHAFELLEFEPPALLRARIRCGKGTYVRSLAHDLGQRLGTGAYLRHLKRTRIGIYELKDAWEIDDFQQAIRPQPSL